MVTDVSTIEGSVLFGDDGTVVYSAELSAIIGHGLDSIAAQHVDCSVLTNGEGSIIHSCEASVILYTPDPPPPVYFDTVLDPSPSDPDTPTALIIPAGVTSLDFKLWGASGGAGQGFAINGTTKTGGGAFVSGTLQVVANDVITVEVGRGGEGGDTSAEQSGSGGWPDGQDGTYQRPHEAYGGGGGGSTAIYLNGALMALAGGSIGSNGYHLPEGLRPAQVTFLDATITAGQEVLSGDDIMAAPNSLDYSAVRPSYGVKNVQSGGGAVRGTNGRAWLRWPEP